MISLESEPLIFFDVDDTILIWDDQCMQYDETRIAIRDPYNDKIKAYYYLIPHKKHIDILKDHAQKGYSIVVWSSGGALWAKAAVEALGLTDVVTLTMAKPTKYCDDLPANETLTTNVFVKDLDDNS